jgi:hypothetical protein
MRPSRRSGNRIRPGRATTHAPQAPGPTQTRTAEAKRVCGDGGGVPGTDRSTCDVATARDERSAALQTRPRVVNHPPSRVVLLPVPLPRPARRLAMAPAAPRRQTILHLPIRREVTRRLDLTAPPTRLQRASTLPSRSRARGFFRRAVGRGVEMGRSMWQLSRGGCLGPPPTTEAQTAAGFGYDAPDREGRSFFTYGRLFCGSLPVDLPPVGGLALSLAADR